MLTFPAVSPTFKKNVPSMTSTQEVGNEKLLVVRLLNEMTWIEQNQVTHIFHLLQYLLINFI